SAHRAAYGASTTFVGRRGELAQIEGALRDGSARLLTLHGPAGVGKSRLALEVLLRATTAAERGNVAEGAACVPMETVAGPSGMPVAITNSLGLRLPPTGSQEEHLLTGLKSRRLLLVLDNLEHLVAGAGLLSRLMSECRGVKLLVTSRAALGIREERILE